MPKNRVNNDVIVYRYFFAFSVIPNMKSIQKTPNEVQCIRYEAVIITFITFYNYCKGKPNWIFFIVQNGSCVSILKSWLELFWYISIPRIRSTVLDTYNTRTAIETRSEMDYTMTPVITSFHTFWWRHTDCTRATQYALTSIKLFSFTFQQI